jgi:hypothetical protein
MTRTRVAVVATTAETIDEDIHRALGLLGRTVTRSAHDVLIGASAPPPRLPGSATKSWQLRAWQSWSESVGHHCPRSLYVASPDRRPSAADFAWAGAAGFSVRPCEPGSGALAESPTPVSSAVWSAAPRRVDWGGERTALLASLVASRRWALRGATALACDAQRAGRLWPARPAYPDAVVELYRLHRESFSGTVCLLDATVCGTDSRRQRPIVLNLVLAGTDPIAVDTVAAVILGWQPRSVPWLARLEEEGLGVAELGQIECVGGGIELSSLVTQEKTWRSPRTRGLGRPASLTRLGEVAERVYHALLWKPWVGRPLHRLYAKSPWGRLDAVLRSGERAWN